MKPSMKFPGDRCEMTTRRTTLDAAPERSMERDAERVITASLCAAQVPRDCGAPRAYFPE